MTPYGTDRVRLAGERVLLSSRLPKGWKPRVPRTLTSTEFPGTAVLWEERYFEVVAAEPLPQGVRYTLEPWPEHAAIRVSDRYDEESESLRAAEWRAAHAREAKRRTVGFLALLTGHLPAIVQERLGAELGVLPSRLTFISLFSEWLVLGLVVAYGVSIATSQHRWPFWTIPVILYLGIESAIRFVVVWTQSRPAGSAAGVLAYIVYWLVTGAPASATPFASSPGHSITISAAPAEVAMADALALREPLATLLPASDQWRLHERFGYDYSRLSAPVATVLLVIALAGVITSAINHAVVSLIVAAGIAVEQGARLAALRRGPAASVLGFLVRPLLRKLL